MGVPAFFRWLSKRYPKVVIDALSEDELEYLYSDFDKNAKVDDPNEINLDADDFNEDEKKIFVKREIEKKIQKNNPSFDNLYLDMNGIIHPCTHPPSGPQPKTEIEMFNNIFDYIDKIMRIVKPQRLIYMAIDGVAPRAKMNQQRSRRFRAARDVQQQREREEEIRSLWKKDIKLTVQTLGQDDTEFDRNVITPGTEFMWHLSKALQYFVAERLHTDPLWSGVKVIYSDASVPGEGEHKILDFIRSQRLQPGYNPNTRHCIYGADADLIMLGLSTHEPHFCVLREAFLPDNEKSCTRCGQQGHFVSECPDNKKTENVRLSQCVQYQFIKLNVVREYLYLEFNDLQLPFAFDFERIIDDFVFFCFFVGNDFLPHSPSLHIREGAIDAIMAIYKHQLPALGGYLTCNGKIDFDRVDLVLNDIAKVEEEFIKSKKQFEDRQKSMSMQSAQGGNFRGAARGGGYQQRQQSNTSSFAQHTPAPKQDPFSCGDNQTVVTQAPSGNASELLQQTALDELKLLEDQESEEQLNLLAAKKMKELVKKMLEEKGQKQVDRYVDRVKLGEDGWKLRYYQDKFHCDQNDMREFIANIRRSYLEGLQWVFSYYYIGCVSWTWFYPFHYAPFASDLVNNTGALDFKFDMGEPASPFEQLLGVFPKQSSHAIPPCYRHLLSDAQSEIIDFYPIDFHSDLNGARYMWMAVDLLPFIDRQRLLKAMKKADRGGEALNQHEKDLNRLGDVYVFFEGTHEKTVQSGLVQALTQVSDSLAKGKGQSMELFASFQRQDELSGTIRLSVTPSALYKMGLPLVSPSERLHLDPIPANRVHKLSYLQTAYDLHLTKLLERISEPTREVEDFEIHHVNRRHFNGEKAIKKIEEVLGFESTIAGVTRHGGYQNNRGVYDGGFGNRQHAGYQQQSAYHHPPRSYDSSRGNTSYQQQQPRDQYRDNQSSQLGKRKSSDYVDQVDAANIHGGQQRPRYDQQYSSSNNRSYNQGGGGYNQGGGYSQGGYQGGYNQGYNQGGYQQQQHSYRSGNYYQQQQVYTPAPINYNLRQYNEPLPAYQAPTAQPSQTPAENHILAQPQQNANLLGLLNQLNQQIQPDRQQQQQQKKQTPNRFQGFNE